MLKDILKENGISMYKIAKDSGIPYSTLNDLVNRRLPIEKIRSGQLRSLSKCLNISMDELFDICDNKIYVESKSHSTKAEVVVKNRFYHIEFYRNGKHYREEILPVKTNVTKYIRDVALWKLEEMLDRLAMEEMYESLYSKKV